MGLLHCRSGKTKQQANAQPGAELLQQQQQQQQLLTVCGLGAATLQPMQR
jgi:hypothetical protein